METPQVQHQRLQALFIGVRRDFDDVLVDQFRGIKYAKIPARFERAQPVQSFHRAVVDATKYGYVLCGSSGKLFHSLFAYDYIFNLIQIGQNVRRFM